MASESGTGCFPGQRYFAPEGTTEGVGLRATAPHLNCSQDFTTHAPLFLPSVVSWSKP